MRLPRQLELLLEPNGQGGWNIKVIGEGKTDLGPPITPAGDQRPPAGAKVTSDELTDRFKREQIFWRQFDIAQQLAASGDRGVVRQLTTPRACLESSKTDVPFRN